MKNRLPLQTAPYQQDYYLLFTSKTSKQTLKLIGDGIKNGLAEGDVVSFEEVAMSVKEVASTYSSWDILNSLDHVLTLGWIRAANDHEHCAAQDRMYAKC